MTNKMFISKTALNNNKMVSKIRTNRDYLISHRTASDLNTYVSFSPFKVFNDGFQPNYDKIEIKENGKVIGYRYVEKEPQKGPGTPGVRSIFNKHGAVIVGSSSGKVTTSDIITGLANEWRISNNVPLMDNRASRTAIKQHSGCTVKELVEASSKGYLGRATYDFSDFMYCKHLGKISNNYLITLRRFPLPVDDYISTLGTNESTILDKDITSQNCQSLGCLVTWMGTPGNEMSNLLKYSFNMPFKSQTAKWEDQPNADSSSKYANGVAALFDETYRKQYMAGQASTAGNAILGKFFKVDDAPYQGYNAFRDEHTKVYGPVDSIRTTYMRSDEGLTFDQKFTITFDYELRSYNGINGRQAMLDLLSNILNVTYTTGTFWGGGYKATGAHQNNLFTNMNIFKANGGAADFFDAFSKDVTNIGKKFGQEISNQGGIKNMIKTVFNQLGGLLIGGALNKLGRPVKVMTNALLSPAPIGFWHLTIGNPHHPIMSVGNLVLRNTTIEHYGPLGLDDFPTGLKVTCELERGKPRDLRDIEKIYMKGNDRIYTSMGPKIFDMYEHSKEYKSKWPEGQKPVKVVGNPSSEITVGSNKENSVKINNIGEMQHVLQKYFGHADTYSIYVAACEQETGAHKKKKGGPADGDSSAK